MKERGIPQYISADDIWYLFQSAPSQWDLAFLLDASGSIGQESYMSMKIFINKIIDNFHVSDEGKHAR